MESILGKNSVGLEIIRALGSQLDAMVSFDFTNGSMTSLKIPKEVLSI